MAFGDLVSNLKRKIMHISSDLNRFERLGKVNKLRKVILSVIIGHMKTAEEIYKHEKVTQTGKQEQIYKGNLKRLPSFPFPVEIQNEC